MKRVVTALVDLNCKQAKPKDKDYKLSDGKGLYLLVTTSGGKYWRFDYTSPDGGKRKTLAIGTYPEKSLQTARAAREAYRQIVADGVDPGAEKKLQKIKEQSEKETFEKIAREWHTKKKPDWSTGHAGRLIRRLEVDLFPAIGNRRLVDITAPDLLALLERIAIRTLETAHRLRITCDMIFRYAIITGKATHNPANALIGALPTVKHVHMSAPTAPKEVANLLRSIDCFPGSFVTKCALQLAPLLFVRPGELRGMEWAELDLAAALWSIPGERMKMNHPHLVPLSKQALVVLKSIQPLTGGGKYVFPSRRAGGKCMSENTVNMALRLMGFTKEEIVGHGFRAMARTMLHEVLKFDPDVIEAQLAHVVPDRLGRAYNRTQHLEDRTAMMQTWADYLDGLKEVGKVIELKRAA